MVDKLKMLSEDVTKTNVKKIAELFPSCVTEGINKDGKTELLIDFEALKANLSSDLASDVGERYQFTWPEKTEAKMLAHSPTSKCIRPCLNKDGEIVNARNIYIEGDNLEALKILRETYYGKIKMIYIDPPYNTGNDSFVYNDTYNLDQESYDAISGDFDSDGMRINSSSAGKYHTNWLNMMYSRLILARDYLSQDGIIYISIDDNEQANLKKMCDEVFGSRNFVANLIWKSKSGGANDSKNVAIDHEYILAYARNIDKLHLNMVGYDDSLEKLYTGRDEYYSTRGPYRPMLLMQKGLSFSESLTYPIETPDGQTIVPDEGGAIWRWSKEKYLERKAKGFIEFKKDEKGYKVYTKQYLNVDYDDNPIERGQLLRSVIMDVDGRLGTRHLQKLFDGKVFTNSKPVELIQLLVDVSMVDGDILMDFFAGSSTSAEALLNHNYERNENCSFILVQLPEDLDEKYEKASGSGKESLKAALQLLDSLDKPHLLTEIGKERIIRVGNNFHKMGTQTLIDGEKKAIDCGFRVFRIDSSNMKDTFYTPEETTQQRLDDQIDNVKEGRTPMDLLIQSMLECSIPLSSKIKKERVDNRNVLIVNDGELVACFDRSISEKTVEFIAKNAKSFAIIRDGSIDSDSTATNFEQIFKTYNPDVVKIVL